MVRVGGQGVIIKEFIGVSNAADWLWNAIQALIYFIATRKPHLAFKCSTSFFQLYRRSFLPSVTTFLLPVSNSNLSHMIQPPLSISTSYRVSVPRPRIIRIESPPRY